MAFSHEDLEIKISKTNSLLQRILDPDQVDKLLDEECGDIVDTLVAGGPTTCSRIVSPTLEIIGLIMDHCLERDSASGSNLFTQKLLNYCNEILTEVLPKSSDLSDDCWMSMFHRIPPILLKIVLQCANVATSSSDCHQKCARELFECAKKTLTHLGLGTEKKRLWGGPMTLQTLEVFNELMQTLPKLDFNGFGRAAKITLKIGQTFREEFAQESQPKDSVRIISQVMASFLRDMKDDLEGHGHELICKKIIFGFKVLIEMLNCFPVQNMVDHTHVVQLLAKSFRLNEKDNNVKSRLSRDVPGWAKTVLQILVVRKDFSSFLLSSQELLGVSGFELMQLMALLCSMLPNHPLEVRGNWMLSKECNLMAKLFSASGNDSQEFSLPPFIYGVEHSGKGEVLVTAYEHIVSHVQAFIMDATDLDMEIVEYAIFKQITSTSSSNFSLSKRLASDLLCFIGRFGPADFCFANLQFYLKLYLSKRWGDDSTLQILIERLSRLLTASQMRKLEQENDQDNLRLWSVISLTHCSEDFKNRLAQSCLDVLFNFISGKSSETDRFKDALQILRKEEVKKEEEVEERLKAIMCNFWIKMADASFVCDDSPWCLSTMQNSLGLTSQLVGCYSNQEIGSIIRCWKKLMSCSANEPFLAYLLADFVNFDNVDEVSELRVAIFQAAVGDGLIELKLNSLEKIERSCKKRTPEAMKLFQNKISPTDSKFLQTADVDFLLKLWTDWTVGNGCSSSAEMDHIEVDTDDNTLEVLRNIIDEFKKEVETLKMSLSPENEHQKVIAQVYSTLKQIDI